MEKFNSPGAIIIIATFNETFETEIREDAEKSPFNGKLYNWAEFHMNYEKEIRPQYPYALTKRLGEETVLHWGQVYGLPVVTLRLFNVYGIRSRISGTYGAVFGVFLAQKELVLLFNSVSGYINYLLSENSKFQERIMEIRDFVGERNVDILLQTKEMYI